MLVTVLLEHFESILQGGHLPVKPAKLREFEMARGKSAKMGKVMWCVTVCSVMDRK